MHFHLPKPIHGWREFAGEVAIIVLGVLIALGMEQLAEAWHDRRVASEARDTIRAEIGADLGELSNRAATEGCIARRLDEIGAFLEQASSGTVAAAPTWIGRPQVWNMDSYRWDAASQAGRVSLLPIAEQSDFSDMYGSLKAVGEAEKDEGRLWAELRSLEGQRHISPETAGTMRSILSQARFADWRIKLSFDQSGDQAKAMGIRFVADPRYPGSRSVCVPIGTPRAEALKLSGSSHVPEP